MYSGVRTRASGEATMRGQECKRSLSTWSLPHPYSKSQASSTAFSAFIHWNVLLTRKLMHTDTLNTSLETWSTREQHK